MAIESASDRAALLSNEDWGVEATKGADTFNVIFDHQYVELDGITGEKPVAIVTDSDITTYSVAVGDTLVINSTNYTVQVLQPDGTGFTLIVLEEQ